MLCMQIQNKKYITKEELRDLPLNLPECLCVKCGVSVPLFTIFKQNKFCYNVNT